MASIIDIEILMELLNKLEEKIASTLETIELLNMENEELKEEMAKIKSQNAALSEQMNQWESKINGLLNQFGNEVAELNKGSEVVELNQSTGTV